MKKLNRNHFILSILSFAIFLSCVDKEGDYFYYKFKNETGEDLKLRFYYSHKSIPPENYDSLTIKYGDYSEKFWEIKGGFNAHLFFIAHSDSIDFISKEVLVRRYRRLNGIEFKTPYSTKYFNTEEIGTNGEIVNVYTILSEDFIAK